ncbi:MAG: zinc-dependent peptidase [Candidatus Hydrogenedentes bacterium]|nr:zinc-dependent peptidase [Candidatus Hydrogenedentota bacterium]
MFGMWRKRKRASLRQKPFPSVWAQIVSAKVSYYECLPEPLKRELQGNVQILLHEKHIEGCGGFEITDEVRVTIAATAAILLLNRESDYFRGLRSILVYEKAFMVEGEEVGDDGLVTEWGDVFSGESWEQGVVILAWEEAQLGFTNSCDGYNVVLHEFAHQLDDENPLAEGLPVLEDDEAYEEWAEVCSRHFKRLRRDVRMNKKTFLDAYGAGDPAEFFAVATEAFFERPIQLERKRSGLYRILSQFYRQDPAAYVQDSS